MCTHIHAHPHIYMWRAVPHAHPRTSTHIQFLVLNFCQFATVVSLITDITYLCFTSSCLPIECCFPHTCAHIRILLLSFYQLATVVFPITDIANLCLASSCLPMEYCHTQCFPHTYAHIRILVLSFYQLATVVSLITDIASLCLTSSCLPIECCHTQCFPHSNAHINILALSFDQLATVVFQIQSHRYRLSLPCEPLSNFVTNMYRLYIDDCSMYLRIQILVLSIYYLATVVFLITDIAYLCLASPWLTTCIRCTGCTKMIWLRGFGYVAV